MVNNYVNNDDIIDNLWWLELPFVFNNLHTNWTNFNVVFL